MVRARCGVLGLRVLLKQVTRGRSSGDAIESSSRKVFDNSYGNHLNTAVAFEDPHRRTSSNGLQPPTSY